MGERVPPTLLIPKPYSGELCTKRDHVVRGGITIGCDDRKYRCDCGLVLVTGDGVSEIRFGLLPHLYPEDAE